jgi:hypothetical protein
VLDDASHQYEPTKASFETLFPLLRPGGLYIIKDWSWGCWPTLPDKFPFPKSSELPRLVCQIMEAAGGMSRFLVGSGPLGTLRPLIATITVTADLVFVEPGPVSAREAGDFSLERSINPATIAPGEAPPSAPAGRGSRDLAGPWSEAPASCGGAGGGEPCSTKDSLTRREGAQAPRFAVARGRCAA